MIVRKGFMLCPTGRGAQHKDENIVPLSNNTTQKRSVNFKRGLDNESQKKEQTLLILCSHK
jgi:hypothetical protein